MTEAKAHEPATARSWLAEYWLSLLLVFVQDGESHWMEGVQLLAVYVILGMTFFFLPV